MQECLGNQFRRFGRPLPTLATPILDIHAEEFLGFDGLSTCQLTEVSDLTGVSMPELTLELVKVFSMSDWAVPASTWLGLGTIIVAMPSREKGRRPLKCF